MAARHFVLACAHRQAAVALQKYRMPEHVVRDRIASELEGATEVRCKFGRVDVLTSHHIIEVKSARKYKEAIGQVLVYSLCFPTRKPRVHLYDVSPESIKKAYDACWSLNIELTYDPVIPRVPDI